MRAACVLSCVGSTGKTTLRPAGARAPRVFEQSPFEIVSLVGTLGADGHHLHLSIADEECVVRGGHALEGCIVRTTAEVVLGEILGVEFHRRQDERTGYDELFISSRPE
ncbi:hypothetical protein AB1Y20_017827 [Prymnesium parvum]